jgi:DNA-binding NtrC family response regulator
LVSYPWPGNVRELAAVVERAAILGGGQGLEVARALGSPASLLPSGESAPAQAAPLQKASLASLSAVMARHIEAALAQTRGRIEGPAGAAALLVINPHTLRARMRKLGIRWQSFRPPSGAANAAKAE